MRPLDLSNVAPGFLDPVHQSQASFRALMNAMARPGLIATLEEGPVQPPDGLDLASTAVALTLLDADTPLWLDPSLRGGNAETYLRFHCGCPVTEDGMAAAFALAPAGSPHATLASFYVGAEKNPELSTTVILMCSSLEAGPVLTARGPGIRSEARMRPEGLPSNFLHQWMANQARFQCGADLILTCGNRLVAIPRSTHLTSAGD